MSYDKLGHKLSVKDPDKGQWNYQYNALGKMTQETFGLSGKTTMTYDLLNRMVARTDGGGTSTWTYGKDKTQHNVGKLIAVNGVANVSVNRQGLVQISHANSAQVLKAESDGLSPYSKAIIYNTLGLPESVTLELNGTSYTTTTTYDTDSRPATIKYPNGIILQNVYSPLGYLSDVKDANTQQTYWHLNTMDAAGHITSFARSNGLVTTKIYDPKSGFLTNITTTPSSSLQVQQDLFGKISSKSKTSEKKNTKNKIILQNSAPIQNLIYQYDSLGEVLTKTDKDNNVTDNYTYDNLNRLTKDTATNGENRQYSYDPFGNMTFKSDVGTYHYGNNAGPHAVTSVTGSDGATLETFQYDTTGNQIATKDGKGNLIRSINYSSFEKPLQITQMKNNTTVNFYYDANRTRFERLDHYNQDSHTIMDKTLYLGNYLIEDHFIDGVQTEHQKLYVGGTLIDISGGKTNTYELLKDNLGSTVGVTDAQGNVVKQYTYTPFGEQKTDNTKDSITRYGFTGQEEVTPVKLIHMNGRMYDPVLGRFLSADPTIQHPFNTQDLNRYSYCVNNPISFTDPTGYGWFSDLIHDVGKFFGGVAHAVGAAVKAILTNRFLNTLVMLTIGLLQPEIGFWLDIALMSAFSGVSTLAQGGSLEDAFQAAAFTFATAYVWHETGTFLGENPGGQEAALPERVLVHGLVGGGLRVAEGGDFQNGFLAAAASESLPIQKIGNLRKNPMITIAERTGSSVIVGGTVATMTGGNFVNGAKTAAFAEMFNDTAHALAYKRYEDEQMKARKQYAESEIEAGKLMLDGAKKVLDSKGFKVGVSESGATVLDIGFKTHAFGRASIILELFDPTEVSPSTCGFAGCIPEFPYGTSAGWKMASGTYYGHNVFQYENKLMRKQF